MTNACHSLATSSRGFAAGRREIIATTAVAGGGDVMRVSVEAKLGAGLAAAQLADYAPPAAGGLLAVLVPAWRAGEADRVLDEARGALHTAGLRPFRADLAVGPSGPPG